MSIALGGKLSQKQFKILTCCTTHRTGMAQNHTGLRARNRGVFIFFRRSGGAEVCEAVVAATEKEEEEWRITKRRVSVRDGNRLQVKERGTVAGRGKKEKKIIKEE